jgi:extracellular elastinolytic metalloproteinase
MRSALFRLTLLGLASASLLSACADDSDSTQVVAAPNARIIRGTGALTPPTTAFEQVARQFAADHGIDAGQLHTVAGSKMFVKFEQVVDGLRVHNAYVKASFDDQGQLVQLIDASQKITGTIKAPVIQSAAARRAAMTELGYKAGEAFHRAPSVEEVIYVDGAGAAQRGYVVETWSIAGNQLDMTLVAGDGKIVNVERRTANDSYKVFKVDPIASAQTVEPGQPGWLGTGAQYATYIKGPNVNAYLDADANNAPDAASHAITDGNFVATADLAQQPSTTTNREVAVQNLFYLNNVTHDILKSHGFDASQNNFEGDDPVNAEAQDGSGTNNANFSTPTTGSPRMQMYLWSGTTPTDVVTVAGVSYGAFHSSFGPVPTATGTTAALALYNDGTGVASDGCEASTSSLTGKIAIVDRGTCDFTVKVYNAQLAGAVGVVIANNVDGPPFSGGGTNRKIKIPSEMVSLADGNALKTKLAQSATLKKNPAPALQVDGDIDSDIVYHEYGHGLTWRIVGSMSGAFAGAIGEGASDTVAFLINNDDRIGEYAYGDPVNGIRRHRYEGYPNTYSAWTGAEVHDDGEIYAAAMWNVRQNYFAAGAQAVLFDDWVRGLVNTPAAPTPEQMRDGMLTAVSGTGRECLVWKGFAKQGIGVGARGTITPRGTVSITQSFTVPSSCP